MNPARCPSPRPLTLVAVSHLGCGLHLGIEHAFLKLSVRIKYLPKVPDSRHRLHGFLVDVSGLGRGAGQVEGEEGDRWVGGGGVSEEGGQDGSGEGGHVRGRRAGQVGGRKQVRRGECERKEGRLGDK